MSKETRIAIFIDQANIWSACKKLGKTLDYSKFRSFFEGLFSGAVVHIFYYQAYPAEKNREYSMDNLHKFFVKLTKGFGFSVRKKELKTIVLRDKDGLVIYNPKTGKPLTREKGNFDVELTMDAVKFSHEYDTGVFFTGDSDFLPLINELRAEKKKIYIFSTDESVSQELRYGTDRYYNIAQYSEIHGEALRTRSTSK